MNFRFEIGSLVMLKAYRLAGITIKGPMIPLLVLERSLVECSGGIQRFYSGRLWIVGQEDRIIKFYEDELEKWEPN